MHLYYIGYGWLGASGLKFLLAQLSKSKKWEHRDSLLIQALHSQILSLGGNCKLPRVFLFLFLLLLVVGLFCFVFAVVLLVGEVWLLTYKPHEMSHMVFKDTHNFVLPSCSYFDIFTVSFSTQAGSMVVILTSDMLSCSDIIAGQLSVLT